MDMVGVMPMSEKLIWIPDRREGTEAMESPRVCASHEYIDQSIKRQEGILEGFRRENVEHQLKMAEILSQMTEQLKGIGKIDSTLVEHNRRREDDKGTCEDHRADMWKHINAVEARQNKKDGTMVVVASVCTGIGAAVAWLLTWLQKNL